MRVQLPKTYLFYCIFILLQLSLLLTLHDKENKCDKRGCLQISIDSLDKISIDCSAQEHRKLFNFYREQKQLCMDIV